VHLLDWVIVAIALIAAYHGFHVGAVAQVLSFAGFLLGLTAGVAILLAVEPHLHSSSAKTAVAFALLIVPGALMGTLGRHLGELAWSALRRLHIGPVDALVGSAIAVAGTLVFSWLFASILVNSALTGVSQAISQSVVIRTVQRVMPPVPNAFATVERYITQNGFPDVLINVVPESPAPVALPDAQAVAAGVSKAGGSVVKIIALGCGDQHEGSGFVTTGGLVVTNAHVVAGTNTITVISKTGVVQPAIPISFDPLLDLSVLRLSGPLGVPDLSITPNFISRGDPAVVLGYPGGGPFDARPAGVLSRFSAQGRDIYDQAVTNRIVYEIDSVVRPGNSGGPLVSPSGVVDGVVFSRSSTNPNVGFALASPAVDREVIAAAAARARVSTGTCAS
jgi:S1-C subfamily serine protease